MTITINMALEYNEIDYDNKTKHVKFECVCPFSSKTIEKQNKIINPNGLTLVAFIEKDKHIFKEVFDQLKDIHSFEEAPNLHLTLLSLLEIRQRLTHIMKS